MLSKFSKDKNKKSGVQQCQRCLKYGHFTYECPNEPAYVYRPSRTVQYKEPSLKPELNTDKAPKIPRITDGDIYRTVKKDESSSDSYIGVDVSSANSSDTSSSSSGSSSSSSSGSEGEVVVKATSVPDKINKTPQAPAKLTNKELREMKEQRYKKRSHSRDRNKDRSRSRSRDKDRRREVEKKRDGSRERGVTSKNTSKKRFKSSSRSASSSRSRSRSASKDKHKKDKSNRK